MTSKLWKKFSPQHSLRLAKRFSINNNRSLLSTFNSADTRIDPASPHELQEKPAVKDLSFGKHFTDHMLRIKWSEAKGWEAPVISKLHNMEMHPASKVTFLAS
jgi:hypothetical protein